MNTQDLKRIKDKVAKVLTDHPHTRNSDAKLIAYYILDFHGDLIKKDGDSYWIRLNDIADRDKLPSFESIRRVRQKLQEMGQYPSDDQVAKTRAQMAENVRTTINTGSWEYNLP